MLVCVLSLAGICSAAGPLDLPSTDLDSEDGWYPYAARHDRTLSVPAVGGARSGLTVAVLDYDGDGLPEMLHANKQGLLAENWADGVKITDWQMNLPPEYCHGNRSVFITAIDDLNGDGLSEAVLLGHRAGMIGWRLWILDPAAPSLVAQYDLPSGEDRRGDGRWDGVYRVLGTTPHPASTCGRALLLIRSVGYDLEPRGILAIDPLTGDEIWSHGMGCNPALGGTCLADLDGDGRFEVLVAGNAPDNLGGRLINGTSDDMMHLIVLDSDGRLLWRHAVSPSFAHGYVRPADIDGDGRPEVCLVVDTQTFDEARVCVYAGRDGALLHESRMPRMIKGLAAAPDPAGGGDLLFVGTRRGEVLRLRLNDGELVADRAALSNDPVEVEIAADLTPEPGVEIVVVSHSQMHYVLDTDLRVLARQPEFSAPYRFHSDCAVWAPEPGRARLLLVGNRDEDMGAALLFEPAPPRPVDRRLWLLALAPALAAAVVASRRRNRTSAGIAADPAALRDLRLRLLEEFELSSHGAIGALRALRRMVWLCRAMTSEQVDGAGLSGRLAETWGDCREVALPRMRSILQLARDAGVTPSLIGRAARSREEAVAVLQLLADHGFDRDQVLRLMEDVRRLCDEAETAHRALRAEVETWFRADLSAVAARVADAWREPAADAGVELILPVAGSGPAGPWCRADAEELAFILENLVSNAVRAMVASEERVLTIAWETRDNMVLCRVADTGGGIPRPEWKKVLDSRISARTGGGLGLPRSQEILRKYGGRLSIESSCPGDGTVMLFSLPENPPVS